MEASSEIKIYEILNTKFSKQESEELVNNIKTLQEQGLFEKIDARVSKAESNLSWRLAAFLVGQAAVIVTLLKLLGS